MNREKWAKQIEKSEWFGPEIERIFEENKIFRWNNTEANRIKKKTSKTCNLLLDFIANIFIIFLQNKQYFKKWKKYPQKLKNTKLQIFTG